MHHRVPDCSEYWGEQRHTVWIMGSDNFWVARCKVSVHAYGIRAIRKAHGALTCPWDLVLKTAGTVFGILVYRYGVYCHLHLPAIPQRTAPAEGLWVPG